MGASPRVLVLRSAGTNCDAETAHAFELAGGTTTFLHVNRLLEDPSPIQNAEIVAIPGGFSYGDDISAGRILAQQIASRLLEPLRRHVERGGLIAGICNGFQVLVKTDLLPGSVPGHAGHPATLAHNTSGRFQCKWVDLKADAGSKCVWTKGLTDLPLPIAHGEGRFVTASDDVLNHLRQNGQVALRYAAGPLATAASAAENPNGTTDRIAGICDTTGRVFGLMPHPERHVRASQHPAWTSLGVTADGEGPGLKIFKNAIEHAKSL